MNTRSIERAVAEFETYTAKHPTDYRAELTALELREIILRAEDNEGRRDYFKMVTEAYAMGFIEGYKRGRK